MAKTLDRTRSYGEITGAGPVRYTQDGVDFDGMGNELVVVGAPPLKATPASGVKSSSGVKKNVAS